MTRLIAVLRCDHAGCGARFTFDEAPKARVPRFTDARPAARLDGWRSGVRKRPDSGPAPTVDFCPQHAGDIDNFSEVVP